MIDSHLYIPTLDKPDVLVVPTLDKQQYHITWPAQTGATGYRCYAGFDPIHIKSLISGATALYGGTTGYTFNAPVYPPNQIIYFWVGYEGVTGSTGISLIDEMGSYTYRSIQYDAFNTDPLSEDSRILMAGEDQLYFIEEMRRRAKAVLEDTGEEALLYIKQWIGLPDLTTQEEMGLDPNYQGMSRNDDTYGTGFYPGYFPAIRIRLRFGGLPQSQLDYQLPGMRPLSSQMLWTIWDPLLHENDLIVRVSTGQRYVIKEIAYGNYRGVPLTQRATMDIVNPTSPLYKLTDADVTSKWSNIDQLEYNRIWFSVMPGPTGAVDYMIF